MQIVFSEKCPDVGTFARICWTGVCGAAWAGGSETVLKRRDCGRNGLLLRSDAYVLHARSASVLEKTIFGTLWRISKRLFRGGSGRPIERAPGRRLSPRADSGERRRGGEILPGGDEPAPPKVTTAATACRRPPVHLRPIRGRRPAVTKRIWRMRGALVRSLQRKSRERLLQPDGFARRDRQQRERPRQRPEAARFRGARHG